MNRLFEFADEYLLQSTWKTLALLKFCLCALGVMIGLALPCKGKKPAFAVAFGVFMATYVPLMLKCVDVARSLYLYGPDEEAF